MGLEEAELGSKDKEARKKMEEQRAIAEKRKVIDTTKRALKCLKAAKADLDSARRWGILDVIGGMYVISGIKLIKMEAAKKHIHEAMTELQKLRNEKDHTDYANKNYSRLGLLGIGFDFGFDGVGPDVYAQFRIEGLRARVIEAIKRVELILQEIGEAD